MGIIQKTRMWSARILLASIFAATVDGMSTEGKYGGKALDTMGFNQAANNYRYVGKLGYGFRQYVQWAFTSYKKDFDDLGNKHGQPKP